MNCPEVEEQEIIERYLASKLSDEEAEAFEEHYLGCKRCFNELRLRHAVAMELGRQSAVAPVHWSFGWRWGLAAAAVLLLGFVSMMVFQRRTTEQVSQNAPAQVDAREEIIARLAVVEAA